MPPYGIRFSPGRGTLFIVGEDSIVQCSMIVYR